VLDSPSLHHNHRKYRQKKLHYFEHGDFNARVPLTADNVLWQISGSLNNLLARLQRSRQDAEELKKMQIALKQAREEIARLKRQLNVNPHMNG
jgi:hypothetical protein